jgi:hypothetical protein
MILNISRQVVRTHVFLVLICTHKLQERLGVLLVGILHNYALRLAVTQVSHISKPRSTLMTIDGS